MLGGMGFYLYTLTLFIFMTEWLRIPAPVIGGLLLLPFVKKPLPPVDYTKEVILIAVSLFFYYVVGMNDFTTFFANLITISVCAFYFNYFVALSRQRLNISALLFFLFLLLSMVILLLDHNDPGNIDPLRSKMIGSTIEQSPAGLAMTQFVFGYQVAAFTAFAFVFAFSRSFGFQFIIRVLVVGSCLVCVYYGMNRSAVVSLAAIVVLFLLIRYRARGVLFIAATALAGLAVYSTLMNNSMDDKSNVLAKTEAKEGVEVTRAQLADANLKIFADYPYGLMFYGKTWDEVTYRNPDFPFGLSSHNAYLMFITYLGPFLGLALLAALYYRVIKIFFITIKHIHLKKNALLITLLFAFIAVSVNAFFHNAWILTADGPSLFLYFAIMQGAKIGLAEEESSDVPEMAAVN